MHHAFQKNNANIDTFIKHDWKLLFIQNNAGFFPLQLTSEYRIDETLENLEKLLIHDVAKYLSFDDKKILLKKLLFMKEKISATSTANLPTLFTPCLPDVNKKIVTAIDQWVQSPIFSDVLKYKPS